MKSCVLISGAFRGNTSGIESIYKNVIKPLNADVFISTWDNQYDFIGFNPVAVYVVGRCFGEKIKMECPPHLLTSDVFSKVFPNFYNMLLKPLKSPFDVSKINKIIPTISTQVYNEENFESSSLYKNIYAFNKTQLKMFYLLCASFSQMRSYEQLNNLKYDLVIRLRPDLIMKDKFDLTNRINISNNEVYTTFSPKVGFDDQFYYGSRKVMEELCCHWLDVINNGYLSTYNRYRNSYAHGLHFLKCVDKDIKITPITIKAELQKAENMVFNSSYTDALETDLDNLEKSSEEYIFGKKLLDFINEVC